MLNFITIHLKEIILFILLGLALIYSMLLVLVKSFGQYTNVDDVEDTIVENKDDI